MTDYSYILAKNYKGKKWVINGDSYEGLIWNDDSPKPSKEVLDAEYLEYKRLNKYKKLRAEKYPSTKDQLDLLYHGTLDSWRTEIKRIKDKYPKPTKEITDE